MKEVHHIAQAHRSPATQVEIEAIKVRFIQIFHLVLLSPIDYSEHERFLSFNELIMSTNSLRKQQNTINVLCPLSIAIRITTFEN